MRARGGPSFRRIRPDEHVGGKERGMTGNHRPIGIFALSEPVEAAQTSLLDVAPTVAYLLGLPVADDLPGRVLLDAISPIRRAILPPERVASW